MLDRIYLLWNTLTVLCHLDFEKMYHIITEIVQSTVEHKSIKEKWFWTRHRHKLTFMLPKDRGSRKVCNIIFVGLLLLSRDVWKSPSTLALHLSEPGVNSMWLKKDAKSKGTFPKLIYVTVNCWQCHQSRDHLVLSYLNSNIQENFSCFTVS